MIQFTSDRQTITTFLEFCIMYLRNAVSHRDTYTNMMAWRRSEPRGWGLPIDMLVYMSNFLDFEDYRNFIRAFVPYDEENEEIRRRLWQLSTRQHCAVFCNKKQLVIEYNFDPARMPDERVLVNLESILPIFGGKVPPGTSQFTSVTRLYEFVRTDVHLNMCTNQYYSSCFCKQMKENRDFTLSVQECSFEHFHHFCWRHVVWWLNDLNLTIISKESNRAAMRLSLRSPFTFRNRISCHSRLISRIRDCWCKKCSLRHVWRLTD
ncbi:Rep1 [Hyposoter didymator ichnovirus]|nr:Rep1 [Hyposoter didymator ichnovirus]